MPDFKYVVRAYQNKYIHLFKTKKEVDEFFRTEDKSKWVLL